MSMRQLETVIKIGSGLVVHWDQGFSPTGRDAGFDADRRKPKERLELKKGLKRYARSDY